jgi:hypothetical protein
MPRQRINQENHYEKIKRVQCPTQDSSGDRVAPAFLRQTTAFLIVDFGKHGFLGNSRVFKR